MTDALLPPDGKPGWYWLLCPTYPVQMSLFEFLPNGRWTSHAAWPYRDESVTWMRATGYRLASPHPIPTPEQLNALHALPDALRDRANKAVVGHSERRSVGDELFGRAGGIVSTFRECAAVIQEAIAAKPAPNDPPGNGLDDVRAAAMEGWE